VTSCSLAVYINVTMEHGILIALKMEAPSYSDMLVSTYKDIECLNSYVSYVLNKSDSPSATGGDTFTVTTVLPSSGPIQVTHNSHSRRNVKQTT
jgi:hypothetical protein